MGGVYCDISKKSRLNAIGCSHWLCIFDNLLTIPLRDIDCEPKLCCQNTANTSDCVAIV